MMTFAGASPTDRPRVIERAPGKLNLALSVGPADETGMHPICSWMVGIDLCDELTVMRLPEDRFSRYAVLWHEEARRPTEIDWPILRDLAVRAHLAMERHVGDRLPVQMKLEKRLPVGGGLGGGSSNAAAMLRAVNELFSLGVSTDELISIATSLGSDVPYFVEGGSAIVGGFGERIERDAIAHELHAVLVFPEMSCPTGHVYAAFDTLAERPLRDASVRELARGAKPVTADTLFNDLTEAAVQVAPELSGIMAEVARLADRPAHLSGSGSTVFVLCDDTLHAEFLAGAIEARCNLPSIAVRTVASERA